MIKILTFIESMIYIHQVWIKAPLEALNHHHFEAGSRGLEHTLQANNLISNLMPNQINGWLYFSIPLGFYFFLKNEKKVKENYSILSLPLICLALLIALREIEIQTHWFEISLTNGLIAILSAFFVTLGIKYISKIIRNTNAAELKRINKQLKKEIQERKKAELCLQQHQENLEDVIHQRTIDLEDTAHKLQTEINQHKEAQTQINLQTTLLEQVDSAIIATDLQFNIIYWNQCAEGLFGWGRNDVMGKPALDVMIRSEHRSAGKRFLDQLARRKSWSGDFTIPHLAGRKIPVELNCTALHDSYGRQIGFTCVAIDITDHVRSERKLQREKEKAVRQAHAKQDFLATMSHEIRTPLNVIIGMTRLLNDAKPNKKQEEYLKSLEFSANHLLTIINDILDLAKIEAGKIKLENIGFNLQHVLEGVRKAFYSRAEEKQIDLRVDIEENLPTYLKGDQVRLTQILNNLMSNALKFTNKGFITIRTKVLDTRQNRVRLLFEVSDSGIGIANDRLEQIFENFTQAQEDTTRKFGGTGLGLTICKKLVQIQKGKLNVKSKVGIGSTFSFELSYEIDEQHANTLEPHENIEYPLQDVRLLLVEDNHANRIVASNFLSKMGVKVDFAENGKQALELVQEKPFDIVLMDIQMPVMNGYEATRAIRKLGESYVNLPIIALTADVISDVRQKVNASGMNDYLSKPFNPEQLNSTIAKNLNIQSSTPSSEEDNVMTLCQILDEYSDDVQFVETLLESLKSSFEKLSQQIRETARQRDIYSLRRIIHKLHPSIKMVENKELFPKLEALKHLLEEDEVNDTAIRLILDDIHKASNSSVVYLDELKKKTQQQASNV